MVVCFSVWRVPPACPRRASGYSTSACCCITSRTCCGGVGGLPDRDDGSDPSGPAACVPLPSAIFPALLPGMAVAAPTGPGPALLGWPDSAWPETSRPPDQLSPGEQSGRLAPTSPGLFRCPRTWLRSIPVLQGHHGYHREHPWDTIGRWGAMWAYIHWGLIYAREQQ